ncbi:hypothetical protein D3C84_1186630 [compost metagenome]
MLGFHLLEGSVHSLLELRSALIRGSTRQLIRHLVQRVVGGVVVTLVDTTVQQDPTIHGLVQGVCFLVNVHTRFSNLTRPK